MKFWNMQKMDVHPIIRPKNLSDNIIMPDASIKHALETLDINFELVIFLQPTSPLRKKDDIKNAYNNFFKQECDSLLSVHRHHGFVWQKN